MKLFAATRMRILCTFSAEKHRRVRVVAVAVHMAGESQQVMDSGISTEENELVQHTNL